VPTVPELLNCLKQHGQRLDSELAKETGVPVAKVRQRLAELAATGAIITCNLTRFEHGKRVDGLAVSHVGLGSPTGARPKAKPPG
jgi:predicted ArsR family transcriptional regulator